MSSTLSAFHWQGTPSVIGKTLTKTQTAPKTAPKPITYSKKQKLSTGNAFTGAGGQIKPGKPATVYKTNGLVQPKNSGFDIPPRVQAQADTDRRHALRKGGI